MTSQVTLSAPWTRGVVGWLFSRSGVSYSDQFSCIQQIGLNSEIKLILDLSHIIVLWNFSHYLIGYLSLWLPRIISTPTWLYLIRRLSVWTSLTLIFKTTKNNLSSTGHVSMDSEFWYHNKFYHLNLNLHTVWSPADAKLSIKLHLNEITMEKEELKTKNWNALDLHSQSGLRKSSQPCIDSQMIGRSIGIFQTYESLSPFFSYSSLPNNLILYKGSCLCAL